jgi:hypothetical protein
MSEDIQPECLLGSEELARYVLSKNQFRSSDGTVKPDVFIPRPGTELSLTRHQGLTDSQIWGYGRQVAAEVKKADGQCSTLYGRADVKAEEFIKLRLPVYPRPTESNPNHAQAEGWPKEKSAQKDLALQIAAIFKPNPALA